MSWYDDRREEPAPPPGEGAGPPPPPRDLPPPPPQPPSAYGYAPAPAAYGPPSAGFYAGWWKRVGAALLDGLIIAVPTAIGNAVIGNDLVETDSVTGTTTVQIGTRGVISSLVLFCLGLVYYVLLEGGPRGQTVGKMALGIRVRGAADGGPIGYGRALGRRLFASVLWWALLVPGLVDVLWPLWDDRKQTLHDKVVDAVVVDG